jgi:hypothetical protein
MRMETGRREGEVRETLFGEGGERVEFAFGAGAGGEGAEGVHAVCAPFLAGSHPAWWPFAIWAVIVGLGIGLWSAWVILLQWPPARRGYAKAAAWIDVVFGLLLLALALRLMLG